MSTLHPRLALLGVLSLLAAPLAAQAYVLGFGEQVADAGDLTGRAVAYLGDVNGDGDVELLVGAPNDEDGGVDSGTAYVVSTGYPQQILFEIHGAAGDNCGTAEANAGDLDGDGVNDFLVGFPGADVAVFPPFVYDEDAGKVRAYSGATGVVLLTLNGPQEGARFGEAVAGNKNAGSVGTPDILVGAPSWDVDEPGNPASNEGWAGLYRGDTGLLVQTYVGTGAGDTLGAAVALVEDLNSDNRDDVAIGSPGDNYLLGGLFLVVDGGRVDVYGGSSSLKLFTEQGSENTRLGTAIAPGGDTDADGVQELLVGAPGEEGFAYLYEGGAGSFVASFTGLGQTAADAFGSAVAPVGDVNRDGHDDFAVGAPVDTGSTSSGYVRVYSGATLQPYLNTVFGAEGGELLGSAIAQGPGDVNGDAWPDVLVGRPYSNFEGTDSGFVAAFELVHHQPSLGFQGPGLGAIYMVGTELYSGGKADLGGLNMPSNAPCWLVASAFTDFLPFKGGILVPDVAAGALFAFQADVGGNVYVPNVPGGGGPFIVYVQMIVKDAAQAQGWALTNALAIEFLP
jgi:hypothetical protein